MGLEGPGTFDFEGAQIPSPTIRELVGDLDKSWGNSKDWILQLRDGRQLVLPLSLYHSLDSMLVNSSLRELWEVGERLRSCEGGDEPLVVVPLATEGSTELESSHVKEIVCKESG